MHDRLSVDSKRLGQIEKAEFIKVVEIREFQNVSRRPTLSCRCWPSRPCRAHFCEIVPLYRKCAPHTPSARLDRSGPCATVLVTGSWGRAGAQGLWRARFEGGSGKTASGWVSFRNGNDARIIKKVEGKTPY